MKTDILKILREEIDKKDKEILCLINERFQISKRVAGFKNINNLEILDRNREEELISNRIDFAINYKIDENFTRELFNLILQESREVQKRLIKNKIILNKINNKQ